ncbi:exo-alpha-sialidase [Brevibacterium sp. JNUCC-42]|nr:exo-alpha-sialidase [Brevibacterium sp. JNUCC-42]
MIGALALAVIVPTAAFAAATPQTNADSKRIFGKDSSKIDTGLKNGSVGNKDLSAEFLIKTENGVTLYSTDKGKTWSKFTPTSTKQPIESTDPLDPTADGVINVDGTDMEGVIHAEQYGFESVGDKDFSVELLIKTENGVTLYSTDKGKTWSKTAPELKTK